MLDQNVLDLVIEKLNMSIRSILPLYLSFANDMLPSSDDWQVKIDKVVEEYGKTKDLPRKLKKKMRKELNLSYSMYVHFRDNNPFNFKL